jgi:hypothetical protein
MGVRKKTLSFPEEVWTVIERNAGLAGTTPSAYVSELVMEREHIRRGLEAVAEYEAEHGAATPEELAWADMVLNRAEASDGGLVDLEPMPESLRDRER